MNHFLCLHHTPEDDLAPIGTDKSADTLDSFHRIISSKA